jgi:hypothetical protein
LNPHLSINSSLAWLNLDAHMLLLHTQLALLLLLLLPLSVLQCKTQ